MAGKLNFLDLVKYFALLRCLPLNASSLMHLRDISTDLLFYSSSSRKMAIFYQIQSPLAMHRKSLFSFAILKLMAVSLRLSHQNIIAIHLKNQL